MPQHGLRKLCVKSMADLFIMENIFHLSPYSGKFLAIFLQTGLLVEKIR